jgi:hypothetical protein
VSDWLQALAAALVLLLPGYAIAAAVFPPGALEREDRLVYSFAFSVGAAALGGLAVQVVLDLDSTVWLALLALVTLVAAAIAKVRRGAAPIRRASGRAPTRAPDGALWAAALLAALAIAGGAIGIAARGVHEQQSRQRFTSLWAVPTETGTGTLRVALGVRNHGGPADYRLDIGSGGAILSRRRLQLGPDQLWKARVDLAAPSAERPLLITLYHRSTPYRSVALEVGAGA